MTDEAGWLIAVPGQDRGNKGRSPSAAGRTSTDEMLGPYRPTFPGSAKDVRAVLQQAEGRPVPFAEVSAAIRRAAGRGDDPASQRFGDVRAFRGLADLRDRGLANRTPKGWVLT